MNLINAAQNFSFNYTAFDQSASLYVAFDIYDVSSGTPSFLETVDAIYSSFGAYLGSYTPLSGKTYLIIGLVYTDDTYSVVDETRSPSSDIYQVISGNGVTYLAFAYSAFDLNTGLYLQAKIYNMTTGTPVSVGTVDLVGVENGVYFGSTTGIIGDSYQVVSAVYTSNSYSTLNYSYAPGCDDFEGITATSTNFYITLEEATLIGQSSEAVLIGQTLEAILQET